MPAKGGILEVQALPRLSWQCQSFSGKWRAKKVSKKDENGALSIKLNQRRCSEDSGPWLENVDQTNLVQASGKMVLQKN